MKENRNQDVSLHSPHSLDECYQRLKNTVDISNIVGLLGEKRIDGKVSKTSIRIRKMIDHRNSFQPFLTATLKSGTNGTIISGRMSMHPIIKIFLCIWFGLVSINLIFVVLIHIKKGKIPQGGEWMVCIIPLIMIIFGIALLKFGKYSARNEPHFLKYFLIDLLDAKEIETVKWE